MGDQQPLDPAGPRCSSWITRSACSAAYPTPKLLERVNTAVGDVRARGGHDLRGIWT